MHVDTNPPISPADEQFITEELNRANGVIIGVKQMPYVTELIERLTDTSECVKSDIEDQLITAFKDALYQSGFQLNLVRSFATIQAWSTVNHITVVTVKHGDNIVVCFMYELH